MKKILFIYNPNSGNGRISKHADELKQMFIEPGNIVDTYVTKGPLDAQGKVIRDARQYDLVICAGGDGTLSEVVSGMMDADRRVPIGFIPAGSTNDTRTGFGLPKDIIRAARICLTGTEFETDVGRFNNEYFAYVASLGSVSAVSCFTPQELKRIWGYSAYFITGLKKLIEMESYDMEVEFDGNKIEGNFFMGSVSNAFTVGGFEGLTGGNVDLQDGLFEVCLFRRPNNIIEVSKEIDRLLIHNKTDRQILDDVVLRFKAQNVIFRSDDPVQWVRDGENGGKHKEAVIEVCNKAVTIISNRTNYY